MAAAAPPRTAKGRATRARLIEAAREVAVAHRGHVEVAWVAGAAGVVPSLVNRYFGSRAGLLSALVGDFFDRLRSDVLDAHLELQGPWLEQERLRLERGVRFHYADPLAAVVYTSLSRDAAVARTENGRIEQVVRHAARNIRRAQGRGELPRSVDPELAGAAMFGAMQRVMVTALGRDPHPPVAEVVELLWRQVAAAVDLDPAAREPKGGAR